jgi:energy-coupling factor transporter ATP-binding protein EcfA2
MCHCRNVCIYAQFFHFPLQILYSPLLELGLDEPTSAMDQNTEKKVVESLTSISVDKTMLIVTHRNPILTMVNRVFVMENGKIVHIYIHFYNGTFINLNIAKKRMFIFFTKWLTRAYIYSFEKAFISSFFLFFCQVVLFLRSVNLKKKKLKSKTHIYMIYTYINAYVYFSIDTKNYFSSRIMFV